MEEKQFDELKAYVIKGSKIDGSLPQRMFYLGYIVSLANYKIITSEQFNELESIMGSARIDCKMVIEEGYRNNTQTVKLMRLDDNRCWKSFKSKDGKAQEYAEKWAKENHVNIV